ncbi:MAG TPA: HAD family phosphatase [Chitinophagaceae bacterium]
MKKKLSTAGIDPPLPGSRRPVKTIFAAMEMKGIRNIIFDFGGVFIEVDYFKTEKAFVDAGIGSFHDLYSQQSASPLFEELETGKIGVPQFMSQLRSLSRVQLTDEQIIGCWNSMLGKFYPEAIEKARELKPKYRLFLFSNTNRIHHQQFMEIYHRQFGRDDFESLFEKVYYSHTCGVRKPHPDAYRWVLSDAGIRADETLFIDDTLVNIKGAEQVGLRCVFLDKGKKLWNLELG